MFRACIYVCQAFCSSVVSLSIACSSSCLPLCVLCNLVSFILLRMWLFLFSCFFFLFLFPSLFHLPHFGVCARTCLCVCVNVCASHVLAFHWTMAEIWNPLLKALTPYWPRVLVTRSKGPVVDYSVNMLQQNLLTVTYKHLIVWLFIDVVV